MTLRNLLRACRNLMTSPLWWSKNVSDASHRAASSRRDSSGVIEHFPLSRDRCRQGCFHMGGAPQPSSRLSLSPACTTLDGRGRVLIFGFATDQEAEEWQPPHQPNDFPATPTRLSRREKPTNRRYQLRRNCRNSRPAPLGGAFSCAWCSPSPPRPPPGTRGR